MKRMLTLVLTVTLISSLCSCAVGETTQGATKRPGTFDGQVSSPPVDTEDDWNPWTEDEHATPPLVEDNLGPEELPPLTVETGAAIGVQLMDDPPSVDAPVYDYSTAQYEDIEFHYTTFEQPIWIEESQLSKGYRGIGEFDSQEEFLKVWTPYAEGLKSLVANNGILADVEIYGEEEKGDHLFGNDVDNVHSYSLGADPDGYQSVNYTFGMFIDTTTESWDRYDYSELVELLQYYTGVKLTTGDLYEMQAIVMQHMDSEDANEWAVTIQSNERDTYDSLRVSCSTFTEGVPYWSISAERTISKWSDLYDRGDTEDSSLSEQT